MRGWTDDFNDLFGVRKSSWARNPPQRTAAALSQGKVRTCARKAPTAAARAIAPGLRASPYSSSASVTAETATAPTACARSRRSSRASLPR